MVLDYLQIPGPVGNLKDFINQSEKVFNRILTRPLLRARYQQFVCEEVYNGDLLLVSPKE